MIEEFRIGHKYLVRLPFIDVIAHVTLIDVLDDGDIIVSDGCEFFYVIQRDII